MKNCKTAALLAAAFMLCAQPLPALAQSEEQVSQTFAQDEVKNGDSFSFSVYVSYYDENGSYTYLYSDSQLGTVGDTWTFTAPELRGYIFKELDISTQNQGASASGTSISFSAKPSDMLQLNDTILGTNVRYYDVIYLIYEKDSNFQLIPGWNLMAYGNTSHEAWYWCDDNLNFVTGFQTLKNGSGEDTLYYFYSDGHMAQSEMVMPDDNDFSKRLFFGSSGALKTGWIRQNWSTVLYEADGDYWYYGDPETGYLKTSGWVQDKGRYYHFAENGIMQASTWIEENGKKYYVTNSGGMATSRWVHYRDNDYYVNEKGEMLTNQWVGQYWVGEDGAWDAGKTK